MLAKPLVSDRLTRRPVCAAALALELRYHGTRAVEIYQYARHDDESSHSSSLLPVALWMVLVPRMLRHSAQWNAYRPA